MDQQYALVLDDYGPGQTLTFKMPLRQAKSRVDAGFAAPSGLGKPRVAPAERLRLFAQIASKESGHPALDFSHSNPDF
jgi:hypothetical protein